MTRGERGSGRVFVAGLALTLLVPCAPVCASYTRAGQSRGAGAAGVSPGHARAFEGFEARVKEYVALRERLEDELPKLPKDATAEQIEAHKNSFQQAVRAARSSARPGDLFTPEVARHVRAVIKSETRPRERREVRETVLGSEVKGVTLRVNHPYPETEELLEMPPALLLKLPQLPKQVKYRYVGRSLLLVDRENGLIIDFMPDALP